MDATGVAMDETDSAVASVAVPVPGVDETIYWSSDEINALIDGWSKHADEVNQSRNEDYMQKIADYIGTNKTAKQVRTKLKKMRSQYIQEKLRMEQGKGKSKWRHFAMLNLFGHKIYKNPNRKFSKEADGELPSPLAQRSARVQLMKMREGNQPVSSAQLAAILTPQINKPASNELPPVFPYDPEVPADVAIDMEWTNWNSSLQYAMTDSGLRTLIRSGFRDVTHLDLLRKSGANISYLNLNYHDKLALEHALEHGGLKLQQYQVITNDDGTVLEVRGCAPDTDENILLSEKGMKMSEWNKTLTHPLTDAGLAKLVKAGFNSPEDVALVEDEAIHELELSLRDKAALKKIVNS
ncbi:uncharacterized protein [Watersipora subatra]|uniref:uncharacterized protein n=1 Tax=Watersipora subatra TaxID=2589382 RepID=UPI00355B7CE2